MENQEIKGGYMGFLLLNIRTTHTNTYQWDGNQFKGPIFSKGIRTKATKLLNAEAFVMVPEKLIDFIKSSLLNGWSLNQIATK